MNFEDRLAVQLRNLVVAHPVTSGPARRRPACARLALSGTGIAAVAGLVAVGIGGFSPSAAFAVSTRADGHVRVTIHDLRDAGGLQRALRDAGVPAVVDYHPMPLPSCPASMGTPPSDTSAGRSTAPSLHAVDGTPVAVHTEGDGAGRTTTFDVDKAAIPAGERLEVEALGSDIDDATVAVAIQPTGSSVRPVCSVQVS